jgi:hypothetical protein
VSYLATVEFVDRNNRAALRNILIQNNPANWLAEMRVVCAEPKSEFSGVTLTYAHVIEDTQYTALLKAGVPCIIPRGILYRAREAQAASKVRGPGR